MKTFNELTLDQLIAKSERLEAQIGKAATMPMLTLLELKVDEFKESLACSRNLTSLTAHLDSAINVRRIELNYIGHPENEEA